MALLSLGRSVVNLNYTAGSDALAHALKAARIEAVVTSRHFLERLKSKGIDLSQVFENIRVVDMESVGASVSKPAALGYFLAARLLPRWLLRLLFVRAPRSVEETAAILFSSGSEGKPKGVMLSHKNIMGNIKQITTVLNPDDQDVMLGTLPIFHSFGFTVTTMLPLTEGIPVVCHPDPTDGYGIGKLAAKFEATMLFATATFLRLYTRNRKLIPLMFERLRMVVAGAERLPEAVRKAFKEKFGKEVYEGYGATETTPVATVNLPDVLLSDVWRVQKGHKPGTVGLPVPGSSIRIVDPESFKELPAGKEGMVLIGGTQIMKGYLGDPEKTARVIREIDGVRWYVTGDKGRLDEEGFLTIVDRYSRFAKIGGEMVSLGMVEERIASIFGPDERFALAAIPDSKKGEAIVLLYEGPRAIEEVMAAIGELDLEPLFVPSRGFKVDSIPLLGSGKVDLKALKKLALRLMEAIKGA
jgi:acyl-[acyl-carrier-protein]-phospholipid O-acyltransferase/long-chain-fatty-acid--[acyl-carrier-protein] ligase